MQFFDNGINLQRRRLDTAAVRRSQPWAAVARRATETMVDSTETTMASDSRTPRSAPLMEEESRAQAKRWLENWKTLGPILEAERWTRLASMTDEQAQLASRRVLELWQPDWHGDDGEELLLHQRVFARARR